MCPATELTEDMPKAVMWNGRPVCLYRVGGEVFATADSCSHGSASLADGDIVGYEIECPFHQGRFDVRTGAATRLPCRIPIETFNVVEKDDAVWLWETDENTQVHAATAAAENDIPNVGKER